MGFKRDSEVANRLYHAAQDRMAMLPNYYRWIARHFRSHVHGNVVELGVGDGHVLQHYLGQVDRVVGVDYNPSLLERLGSRFPSSTVTGQHLDLRVD